MIVHTVLLDLANKPGAELASVMDGLAALTGTIDGYTSFEHGPNRDFESRSAPFSYGFVGLFDDREALQTYADNTDHKALGKRLTALCRNAHAGLHVSDIETA